MVAGVLHIKVGDNFSLHYNGHISDQLPDLRDQISLMPCWCSVSESGREHITFSFAYNSSLYVIYECLWPIAMQINLDAKITIVDALLTLIFRMGQQACHFPIWLYMRPILQLWTSAFNCQSDYPQCKTRNHWHTIDSHFQDGVGSVSLLFLIIKAASTWEKDKDVAKSLFCN